MTSLFISTLAGVCGNEEAKEECDRAPVPLDNDDDDGTGDGRHLAARVGMGLISFHGERPDLAPAASRFCEGRDEVEAWPSAEGTSGEGVCDGGGAEGIGAILRMVYSSKNERVGGEQGLWGNCRL